MGRRLTRNKRLIKFISEGKIREQKRILASVDRDFINTCRDCCKNILEGRINISPKTRQKLVPYKKHIRKFGRPGNLSLKAARNSLQTGGFFTALIPILSSLIGPVLSSIFADN